MRKEKIELPIEEIIKKYEAGSTTRKLGVEYGVSHGTISNRIIEHYKKFGEDVPDHKTKELPMKDIIEQYESGIKIQDLADQYQVIYNTMTTKITKYYEDIGKMRVQGKKGRKKLDVPIEDIIDKYENGLSQDEIADEYKVSQVYIWKRINEYYTQTGGEKPIKKSGRKRKEIPIDEIVEQYENGISQVKLAQKYETSNLVISARINEYYKSLGKKTPQILRTSSLVINYLTKGLSIEKILEVAENKNVKIPQHIIDTALEEINKKNLTDDIEERE